MLIKSVFCPREPQLHHRTAIANVTARISANIIPCSRVRTLTGKEIELDIEPDDKVRSKLPATPCVPETSVRSPRLALRRHK
ncbi:Ubiquitin supergroup [Penicillium chermesinum]|uniref:Ubiquitin supergroup n=1 Tax=Penicillium chermesinum TaxID=63820 RepID=A0A9W9TNA2_9EURO|nr:Ubiquitin supergroup [Penicillium chermesinum]KAJ5232806.1 Ubiquitin supergroup [Penicillium chermesinum]